MATKKRRTRRLDHKVNPLQIGDLGDMEVEEKIVIQGINQGLPEESYELFDWEFIKRAEKINSHRYRVEVPYGENGRYVLITRTE